MNLPPEKKCAGASRWVPTCRVVVISWPPALSNASRLTHLMLGPSYDAKAGVWTEKSWLRSISSIESNSVAPRVLGASEAFQGEKRFVRSALILEVTHAQDSPCARTRRRHDARRGREPGAGGLGGAPGDERRQRPVRRLRRQRRRHQLSAVGGRAVRLRQPVRPDGHRDRVPAGPL